MQTVYLTRDLEPQYINNIQPNNKNYVTPIKNWANNLNRYFSKEYTQMINKHNKRGSTSLVIREIKITTRYYFTFTKRQ